mmetsp:Transcript_16283/g.42193  ORF Transcript_16283/g.42193 Transcript_16283/m.42193 type:complete len:288 (+) Transcript_16283:341-1204(+)
MYSSSRPAPGGRAPRPCSQLSHCPLPDASRPLRAVWRRGRRHPARPPMGSSQLSALSRVSRSIPSASRSRGPNFLRISESAAAPLVSLRLSSTRHARASISGSGAGAPGSALGVAGLGGRCVPLCVAQSSDAITPHTKAPTASSTSTSSASPCTLAKWSTRGTTLCDLSSPLTRTSSSASSRLTSALRYSGTADSCVRLSSSVPAGCAAATSSTSHTCSISSGMSMVCNGSTCSNAHLRRTERDCSKTRQRDSSVLASSAARAATAAVELSPPPLASALARARCAVL